MANTTRKKVKIVGKKQYLDPATGEVSDFQVINIEERDANFHKIWLSNVIQSLDLIGNQKIRFAFWLMDQANKDNEITLTLRQMSELSKISLETVRLTVKSLIESDFLRRKNMGVYQINPNSIFKGGNGNRLNVLFSYQK
ncbi:TPA: replication/maintenance protein RepL [Escherichia coli]|uniref:replication/maintenance protein RepL n=1 Tax=Escherichia coli TaxID=562 RepID=UPI001110FD65|nr:replication/maintenance protein RepL [Escherichia coli]EEW4296007.1 replication/maintenance protein [Escherichia coli]EFC2566916.1 replication/maintenance protein [Escherichia coli]EFJ5561977.1 replication/maintenance protein [Escherichia coli]EFJ5692851.1 replication/maintenance protein [Escherichia coli]EFN1744586.1 replication/maintenance protein [Escherichia coli]